MRSINEHNDRVAHEYNPGEPEEHEDEVPIVPQPLKRSMVGLADLFFMKAAAKDDKEFETMAGFAGYEREDMGTKRDPGKFDCYDKAEPDEPLFTLLARDPFAAVLVEQWAMMRDKARQERIEAKTISPADNLEELRKIDEARACADAMREWRRANRG